ncbi:MAG: hypothetical protein H6728_13195 [Myxococcales bacterium]|nr:hypothetical protein [Myxococcales bacterium]MCB9644025.1 hypothetical protein [Myxococcales bacterium]
MSKQVPEISLPFPYSLCHQCEGLKLIYTKKQTIYMMCMLREERYFSQPIRQCGAFVAKKTNEEQAEQGE